MIDETLAFLTPHYCCSCGQVGMILCDNCKYNIINELFSGCAGCQRPALRYGICGKCRTPYRRAWIADSYRGPVGEVIKEMKFTSAYEAATVLGRIMAEMLPALPPNITIVPVPTVRSHVRQRGFDHTKVMTRVMAKQLNIPAVSVVERVDRLPQQGATARQRRAQAKGAFTVKRRLDSDRIYLLVDDVVTTTATLREASHQLRLAGAGEVWVAALARETLD